MRYFKLTHPDINNGEGCRVTVWTSGCSHYCPGCHNPELWNFEVGTNWNGRIENRLYEILSQPYIQGVTFSGGDPLYHAEDILSLCRRIKEKFPTKDIWVYTGFTEEYVREHFADLLAVIDVIVTEPYIEKLRDITLPWVGSSNQKVIYLHG